MIRFSRFAVTKVRASKSAVRRTLRLEFLEDRVVPSTLTVGNTLDSGPGSQRAAVAASNTGDTITFPSSLRGQTFTLTGGPIEITHSLNISGPGASNLTIGGNGASRIFNIDSGAIVNLSGLTLSHGFATAGGAIDNAGDLTFANSTLVGNKASGGMGGGAILNEVDATLSLQNDLLNHNQAVTTLGSDNFGGALLNEGDASVTGCTFTSNQATGAGSTSFFGGSNGGAIDNFNCANLDVTDTTFFHNQAVGASGGGSGIGGAGGVGGAIESNAGYNMTNPSSATISDCMFIGNLADGNTANAGAVDSEGTGVYMSISGSTFVANRSVGTGNGEGTGGALENALGTMLISDCTLASNQAIGGNPGSSATVNPPWGGGQGSGMVNYGGTLTVTDSTFAGNEALGGTDTAGPGGIATGGAISDWGTALTGSPGVLTVMDSTFTGNMAVQGKGRPSTSAPSGGLAAGGAIDVSFTGSAFISGSTFSANRAVGTKGSAGVNGGTTLGGAISVGFSTLFDMTPALTDNSSVQITDSTIARNAAIGGAGGTGGNGGAALGGGIGITVGSSATLSNTTVDHNTAQSGVRGSGGQNGLGAGGGVYTLGTFTDDIMTTIGKNKASSGGGTDNDLYV